MRDNFTEQLAKAGDVIYAVNPETYDKSDFLRFTTEKNPHQISWCNKDRALPISEFLKRKPTKNYYALIFKHFFKQKIPYFVENTLTVECGLIPFRFESIGEALYFLDLKERERRSYQIVHFL